MCGIAGVHRRGDVKFPKLGRFIDELLPGIEERGQDSTGLLAMMDSGKVQMEKAVVPVSRFIKRRSAISANARTVMVHTRWATVGKVNQLNAHPVINDRLAAVHNGTIRNADVLFKTFRLKRHAQVDSEIIPALIAHAGWENAGAALELLRGGCATAVVNADKPNELILARLQTYPLVYFLTDDFIVWASTERAIAEAWHMTFKRRPPKGEWGRLGEWSMLRVNGTVEREFLDRPAPPVSKSKPDRVRKPGKSTKAPARKRRKAGRSGRPVNGAVSPAAALPSISPTLRLPARERGLEALEGMDEMVRTLMRTQGYEFQDAYTVIHGRDLDADTEAWREQLWREMDDDLSRLLMDER